MIAALAEAVTGSVAVLVIAATPASTGAATPSEAKPLCAPHGAIEVAAPAAGSPALLYRTDRPATLNRLADLPRPDHEKAVLRSVSGCAAPLVIGFGVGR